MLILALLVLFLALGSPGDRPWGYGAPNLAPDLEAWVENLKSKEGVFIKEEAGQRVVLISMGAKPTGGYSIKVERVHQTAQAWIIETTTHSPGPDDIVTQAITYPYQLIRIPDDGLKIEVRQRTS